MRYTADHAFHIGSQHLRGGLPCQDYALSKSAPDHAIGVISDGCSSGGETDVGARVIARSTFQALTLTVPRYFATFTVDDRCEILDDLAQSALGLEQSDMLATCGYVAATDRSLVVRLIGDGVIAAKSDRELIMTRFDWAKNMPVYRAYADDKYAGFIAAHGGEFVDAMTVTRHIRRDGVVTEKVIPQPLYDFLRGLSDSISPRNYEFVAVFSDGVTQIDGMDWRDVVAQLMSFKSAEGAFVKRRMLRFLKDCQAHGKGPIDDISMACIHIDHEAE
ncbi:MULTISPECIES: protein phosphatase 2C domain-containing protein [unclassified Bradyrhizobium]|uniref:protein phosphatase 2C domain-containing protein n=1 Tax=Bradyrhizobium sp. USDA 4541 TaxID=2817704 RepID=UPI0020A49874|nr:protein phosphatase 2C domain-containing protein [Bradyrhizobium sp. USDA 4541]MCP1852884.1 hypothetical protein [Bradyrhizobium sp. USDA 4541]